MLGLCPETIWLKSAARQGSARGAAAGSEYATDAQAEQHERAGLWNLVFPILRTSVLECGIVEDGGKVRQRFPV